MEVSVVILATSGDQCLRRCLVGVTNQDCSEPTEILVVTDSASSEDALLIAQGFGVQVVTCAGPYFFPGKALNLGFARSRGRYLVSLAANGIPVNDKWLERLLVCFHDPLIAAVYGRQELLPAAEVPASADLSLAFGPQRRVERKDSGFDRANAMVRRDVWLRLPFDETLTTQEDRAWASQACALGHAVAYEPQASVYRYLSARQGEDVELARRVVKLIEF